MSCWRFFGGHSFPAGHPFAGMRVSPEMPGGPDVWMLGSSMWSSAAAVEFGLPYSFAHFFSPVHTRAAIETYRRGFAASAYRSEPEATVAVGVICAETRGGGGVSGFECEAAAAEDSAGRPEAGGFA